MIDHNINLKISNPTQRKYYRDKDIYCNIGDTININISLLPEYSHIKINVKCENCGFEKLIQYSDYLKCIKKQNFYCCSKCKRIKTDKTNIEKYGFITNLKCEDTKDKIKKTCLEKYGVDNCAKTDKSKVKAKSTCLKKYGKISYLLTEEYKEKVRKRNLEIYKCEYYIQSDDFKMKSEKTQLERYGIPKYTNPKKVKETCLKRYGCEYISQYPEIFKKQQLSGYRIKPYENVTYQGTYELDFLLNFYNILKIENPPSIKYKYQDKSKVYHPDFYLPDYNLIVEIKSNYIYELHKERNECKKLSVIENGYNFIFIIDKNYTHLKELL
jgi:hypothetical protein